MKCIHCHQEIPAGRLAVLPNTRTCVKCSTVKPAIGLIVYSGKNTPELVVVDSANKEHVRQAFNGYARARATDYNPVKKNPLRKCFESISRDTGS